MFLPCSVLVLAFYHVEMTAVRQPGNKRWEDASKLTVQIVDGFIIFDPCFKVCISMGCSWVAGLVQYSCNLRPCKVPAVKLHQKFIWQLIIVPWICYLFWRYILHKTCGAVWWWAPEKSIFITFKAICIMGWKQNGNLRRIKLEPLFEPKPYFCSSFLLHSVGWCCEVYIACKLCAYFLIAHMWTKDHPKITCVPEWQWAGP